MEFKRSAGIFATGFVLSLIGYVLGAIFAMSSAAQASSYYSSSSAMVLGVMAFIFLGTALIGSIMTVVGAYRALVKIDALHVPAAVASVPAAPASAALTPTLPTAASPQS